LVEEIRRRMFVVEDIPRFAIKGIQTVLKNVENAQWALASKTASEELKQKVLGNMSTRAAEMPKEKNALARPGQAVGRRADAAIDRRLVRRLEDGGEITINAGEETDELV